MAGAYRLGGEWQVTTKLPACCRKCRKYWCGNEKGPANLISRAFLRSGGEGGIRTLDTVSRIHTFQACSFNRSDTSPDLFKQFSLSRRANLVETFSLGKGFFQNFQIFMPDPGKAQHGMAIWPIRGVLCRVFPTPARQARTTGKAVTVRSVIVLYLTAVAG